MAGLYFEEFEVGQVFKHQPGRTVTEMDNVMFSCLTMNPQPLHVDEEFAKETQFGQRLVNSILTLGIAVGLSVGDTTLGTTLGNLGFQKSNFPCRCFTATRCILRRKFWINASLDRAPTAVSSISSTGPPISGRKWWRLSSALA